MIIKRAEFPTFENNFIRVSELFSNHQISFAVVEINGRNREIRHLVSESWYFVIRGTGKFTIDGDEQIVSEGDLVYIPKGITYFDEGELTMLSVNSPGYDTKNVEEM